MRRSTVFFNLGFCLGKACHRTRDTYLNKQLCRTLPMARSCASRAGHCTRASATRWRTSLLRSPRASRSCWGAIAPRAGLIEKAAEFWGKAGLRSLARSALVEAVEQLTRALGQIAA